jgi:UPF0042 nucleotide-binding protein
MDVVIITGMSGAGKKTVGHLLEDLGYYCVDNMPVSLIPAFFELYEKNPDKNQLISFTLDIRIGEDIERLLNVIQQIKSNQAVRSCKLLYLNASDEILIQRYKETRHVHPLVRSIEVPLETALRVERSIFSNIEQYADFCIDTSTLRPMQLKELLISFLEIQKGEKCIVNCMSFGFKYGVPRDLDLMFDVRCFPNPFYIPELKTLTGLQDSVRDFVLSHDETKNFLNKLYELFDLLYPLYEKEGKAHLTVGIGCTGGKHRSVVIAEALASHFADTLHCEPIVIHRDIQK